MKKSKRWDLLFLFPFPGRIKLTVSPLRVIFFIVQKEELEAMQDFDKYALSRLLRLAVGSRTQQEFSKQIGLSAAHLSRLVRGRLDSPPTVYTLKKIASHAENGVSYQALLDACGYSLPENGRENPPGHPKKDCRFLRATILSALETLPVSWTVKPMDAQASYDLSVSFQPLDRSAPCWYFYFLAPQEEPELWREMYMKLLYLPVKPEDKCSFITDSKEIYQQGIEDPPLNLSLALSIILVDPEALVVLKEQWLCPSRACKIPSLITDASHFEKQDL